MDIPFSEILKKWRPFTSRPNKISTDSLLDTCTVTWMYHSFFMNRILTWYCLRFQITHEIGPHECATCDIGGPHWCWEEAEVDKLHDGPKYPTSLKYEIKAYYTLYVGAPTNSCVNSGSFSYTIPSQTRNSGALFVCQGMYRNPGDSLVALSHTSHCFEGCGLCLSFKFGNPFMHCVTSQYVFKPCGVVILHNHISIATITFATASPWRVPLNGIFYLNSATQWNKLQIWKLSDFERSNSLGKHHLNSVGHNMYVIKVRAPACVRNDSEKHSTGVTGLHFQLRRSCNPIT